MIYLPVTLQSNFHKSGKQINEGGRLSPLIYACTTFIDTQIAIVLDTLKETGLDQNTIVIFFADHGFHIGEHDMWSKYSMFEQSTRVPLMVYVPCAEGNGEVCNEIVELVDLIPTLCSLWEIPPDPSFEGISFKPLLERSGLNWKKAAFSSSFLAQGYLARSVRTKQYRYTEWTKDNILEREFYDLHADPSEHSNLIEDQQYQKAIKEHKQLLKEGCKNALPIL